jgi:hypothetical protein
MNKDFSKRELKFLKTLKTPIKMQEFIDGLEYNKGKRVSLLDVYRLKKGDCLEASCFAAYVFGLNKIKSFVMDLECKNPVDDDHVICVFKSKGLFGAVAQSKFLGLKYRNPVYKDLRELAMSYFENYFNYEGEYDLMARSVPLKIKKDWIYTQKSMNMIEKLLDKIKHIRLIPKNTILATVPVAKFKRELMIVPKGIAINKRYLK